MELYNAVEEVGLHPIMQSRLFFSTLDSHSSMPEVCGSGLNSSFVIRRLEYCSSLGQRPAEPPGTNFFSAVLFSPPPFPLPCPFR